MRLPAMASSSTVMPFSNALRPCRFLACSDGNAILIITHNINKNKCNVYNMEKKKRKNNNNNKGKNKRKEEKEGREECSTTDVYLQCSGTHDHTSVYKLRQI